MEGAIKNKYYYLRKIGVVSIALTLTAGFFGCKKLKTPAAVAERENWYASFEDSVKFYQEESQVIENKLGELNGKIAGLLNGFEKVKKPREVTGYYLLKGWSGKVPLQSTGIYARINENETLELIATLSGGTFNRIGIGDLYSEVVKHDQGLNYRHPTFNTVFFTGGKADTIAKYIAENRDQNLKLEFLEGGSRKSSFTIPGNEKDMIAQTWKLLECQLEIKQLQKQLAICSRKIDTFRRVRDDKEKHKEIEKKTAE